MQLILTRHADAEPESVATLGDFGRALTALGRRQARDSALWLASALAQPLEAIATSPLVRAVQTAEALANASQGATLAVAAALGTGQSLEAQLDLARTLDRVTALVGHEPLLGELAAALLSRARLPFPFERGACLILDAGKRTYAFNAYRLPFGEPVRKI